MSLKIAILTTPTPHHAYFVRELGKTRSNLRMIVETGAAPAPFPTAHPFESERDRYECDLLFGGKSPALSCLAPSSEHANVNDPDVVTTLRDWKPDVAVVFGTRRIRPELIDLMNGRLINLHGGDPENYRGLDTHLWAIYHHDFAGLVTTLHHVNADLDDGAIVSRAPVALHRNMRLHELRKSNTDTCIALTLNALERFEKNGALPKQPQAMRGRYYSFMPAALKDLCVRRFEAHTSQLRA